MSSSFRGLATKLLRDQLPSSSRGLKSDAASRYSPTPFSRTKPLDVSASRMPKNPFIEAWMHKRNNLHEQFTWNLRNTVEVSYFLLGIPAAFLVFGHWTMNSSDAANGYPKRDYIFSWYVHVPVMLVVCIHVCKSCLSWACTLRAFS